MSRNTSPIPVPPKAQGQVEESAEETRRLANAAICRLRGHHNMKWAELGDHITVQLGTDLNDRKGWSLWFTCADCGFWAEEPYNAINK